MENEQKQDTDRPFWVILSALEHFISGHDTLAEAEARYLNQHAKEHGRLPHYPGASQKPGFALFGDWCFVRASTIAFRF